MTEWHRLFGLTLIDYFAGTSYHVELEHDLSRKQQFVDVIIIEQNEGYQPKEIPDGLENLSRYNILSYKSFQESFSPWACDELVGHYVNYRKQVSPSMDQLFPEEMFQLYGVSTRYPQKLSQITPIHQVVSGVYEITWGSRQIRLIVLSQIAEVPRNALWQLFSAIPEHVEYGATHYQWHIDKLSTVLYELFQKYRMEGIAMPYTVNDYYREFTRSHLDWLSPEERVRGLALKERIYDVPPDEILNFLLSEDIIKYISTAKLDEYLQKFHRQVVSE